MPFPASNPAGKVVHPRWAESCRGAAESVLEDVCTVRRPGGSVGVLNPESGSRAASNTTLATNQACRVSYRSLTSVQEGLAGSERVATVDYLIQFAIGFVPVLTGGDEITITTVGPNGDPAGLGRTYRVCKDGAATFAWTRRVLVEHITHG